VECANLRNTRAKYLTVSSDREFDVRRRGR